MNRNQNQDQDQEDEIRYYDASKIRYITYILCRLSVSPGYVGYYYLREAILFADSLGTPVPAQSTRIYNNVARRYETDPRRIERSIRTVLAMQTEFMTRRTSLRILTGLDIPCKEETFRNMEFISFVTESLRLRQLY